MNTYAFRPVTARDMPMLADWLRSPEVVRWWGDPGHELALLADDLTNPDMTMQIVSFGSVPFAYAQHYDVHRWPQPHFAPLPAGSRAIDAFIGLEDMIGCGHGARFLRLLALQLLGEGAPVVAIDPGVSNARARRAYERAGFRGDTQVETGQGPAILMVFKR